MAINYLNSINLNQNELIKAQIENQPNNASAGTGVEGQLYYDTTLDVLKVWANGAWSEVGGGVETLTTTDGTYIDLTPNSATAGAVTVTADLSAADGTASAASRFLTKDNTWATVPQGDITALTEGTYIGIDNPGGPIPTINHDSTSRTDTTSTDAPSYGGTFEAVTGVSTNATGHVTAIDVSTVTIPASDNTNTTYDLSVGAGAANSSTIDLTAGGSGSGTDSITVQGTTLGVKVTESGDTITVALQDNITVEGLTVNNDVLISGDLTVTGDTIVSNETIKSVENNTIAFEGTVVDDTVVKLTAENATGSDKVATLQNKTGTIALLSDIDDAIAADSYSTGITDTDTVTHSLDTRDVIVQLYDLVTFDTVYADVVRTTKNSVNITFANTPTNSIQVLVQKIG